MRSKSLFVSLLLASVAIAKADIGWSVNIVDPTNQYAAYHDIIRSNILAAGDAWGTHLEGGGTIDVNVSFASVPTANGGAGTSVFDHTSVGGASIYQWGTASEINTGIDPNGSAADINMTIGHDWMNNVIWWDPNPTARVDAIPQFHVDGMSVMMHEIGHGLAFNGWMNGTSANFRNDGWGPYGSMYDEQVTFDGSNVFFNGANAVAAYGGPVPLTYGNYAHYGNAAGRPGSELAGTRLMNGVVSYYQTRWEVTDLDLGFLADTGYTLRTAPVPEPASIAALGLGVAALVRRRKKA